MFRNFYTDRQVVSPWKGNGPIEILSPELRSIYYQSLSAVLLVDAQNGADAVPLEDTQPFAVLAPEVHHTVGTDMSQYQWNDHLSRVKAVGRKPPVPDWLSGQRLLEHDDAAPMQVGCRPFLLT